MRPFDKPALSVEQQLELLKQRGLHIANDDRAMRFLEVVTLFRLSPYMRPFQESDPEHTFKPGSKLKAIVDIYRFDGSLRRITMDAIERVEVAIRATISNHMCPKYGPDWIADASVFSSSYSHPDLLRPLREQLNKERNKLRRDIDRIKKGRKHLEWFLNHQLNQHTESTRYYYLLTMQLLTHRLGKSPSIHRAGASPLLVAASCRIACHDDPRRAVDHHRPLAGGPGRRSERRNSQIQRTKSPQLR
uniref:Abi family protein n=1 Tax=Pseudomonas corrugata TaxID=47879 RepID=UPI000AE96E9F